MVRGITFDWWHTIAETPWPDYDDRMRHIRVERIGEALAAAGSPVGRGALYQAYDAHTELLVGSWKDLVDLTAEEQIRAFLEFAGLGDRIEGLGPRIEEAFGAAIESRMPRLYPGIEETLARLRDLGYRIGLISNTGRTWGRFLRRVQDRLGIGSYFDVRVFSDEVRVRKPDPRIFRTAIEALRIDPSETVHIGDDATADVAGAKQVGLRAVWFNTGFWPGARADRADAEIGEHPRLLKVLEAWG